MSKNIDWGAVPISRLAYLIGLLGLFAFLALAAFAGNL